MRKDFYLKNSLLIWLFNFNRVNWLKTTVATADRSMTHRSNMREPHWSTRWSTWLRIRVNSSHARMPCSWPRSAAATAWASRHITIYLTQQLTQLVPDVVKVHTLWNTGFWSVLELVQHDETYLVKRTRSWRSWRINQERQCWCLGATCRAAVSASPATTTTALSLEYELRPRSHDRELVPKVNSLTESNFLIRQLYKNCY